MAESTLGGKRLSIYCSSSIANWEDKLKKRTGLPLVRSLLDETIFFGLYTIRDYTRFLLHRGPKRIFWCGGDILNLSERSYVHTLSYFLSRYKNYCENEIEAERLQEMGISPKIIPMIFDGEELPISFTPVTNRIHIYISIHLGREEEYGLKTVFDITAAADDIHIHVYGVDGRRGRKKNLTFHGLVSNNQFNEEIRNYHGSIRLNKFDGVSEITVKSAIMGQYPISIIEYPYVISPAGKSIKSLIKAVRRIKTKRGPNEAGRNFWLKTTNESLNTILHGK